jgi:hypothetical protein
MFELWAGHEHGIWLTPEPARTDVSMRTESSFYGANKQAGRNDPCRQPSIRVHYSCLEQRAAGRTRSAHELVPPQEQRAPISIVMRNGTLAEQPQQRPETSIEHQRVHGVISSMEQWRFR